MPKVSLIEQDLVETICISLLSKGTYPSINLVQTELKKSVGASGSTLVVTKMINDWKLKAANTLAAKVRPGIPENLSKIADQFISSAMDQATLLLQEEADEIRNNGIEYKKQCDIEVEKVKVEFSALNTKYEEIETELKAKEAEILAMTSRIEELLHSIQNLDKEIDASNNLLEQRAVTIQNLREEVLKNNAEFLAKVSEITSEHNLELKNKAAEYSRILLDAQTSHSAELKTLNVTHSFELTKERDLQHQERKRVYAELDRVRVENQELTKSNTKLASDNKAEVGKLKDILEKSTIDLHVERSKFSTIIASNEAIIKKLQDENEELKQAANKQQKRNE